MSRADARRLLKQGLARVLDGSGFCRWRQRGRVLMLLYHRICPDALEPGAFPSQSLAISPSVFEEHLRHLREAFEPLSFADYLALKAPPAGGRRYLMVTFDDGWADNYEHAFPLLQKYGMTATVFLATGHVGTSRVFWWHALGELLAASGASPSLQARLDAILKAQGLSPLAPGGARRVADVERLIEGIKAWPFPRIEALECALAEVREIRGGTSCLSWAQIEELSRAGWCFGPHSVHHPILTALPPDAAEREIRESWAVLSGRKGVNSVPVFSYPGGQYNEAVEGFVQKAGLQAAVTVQSGLNAMPSRTPFRLRRVNVDRNSAQNMGLFKWRLAQSSLMG